MTERRKHIMKLAGLGSSLLVVLGTMGLYYSFVYEANPSVKGISYAVVGLNEAASMLDSVELRRPLSQVYPEGMAGLSVDSVRLSEIEAAYLDNPYINSSKVYFDKHYTLKVEIRQRIPAMRILSNNGADYYVDRDGVAMPTSRHFTPRVMVATGHIPLLPFDEGVDSSALHQKIFTLASAIEKDEFMKSYISEINVDAQHQVYLHPLMGEFRIRINDLNELSDKFENLKIFLLEGLSRTGWDAYSELIIDYNHQIIGKKILNP